MNVTEIYRTVTDRIVAELERGTAPWVKPWTASSPGAAVTLPYNAASKRPYSGVNILVLWDTALRRGYPVPAWLTFQQAKALGAFVRKGERGIVVVFAKR